MTSAKVYAKLYGGTLKYDTYGFIILPYAELYGFIRRRFIDYPYCVYISTNYYLNLDKDITGTVEQ